MEYTSKEIAKEIKGHLKNGRKIFRKMRKFSKLSRKSFRKAKRSNDPSLTFDQLKNLAKEMNRIEEWRDTEYDRVDELTYSPNLKIRHQISCLFGMGKVCFSALLTHFSVKKLTKKLDKCEELKECLKKSEDKELKDILYY